MNDLEDFIESDNQVRFFNPSIATDTFSVSVTPCWAECIRIDINSGNIEKDVGISSNLSLLIYDIAVADKLISDLQKARDEISIRKEK